MSLVESLPGVIGRLPSLSVIMCVPGVLTLPSLLLWPAPPNHTVLLPGLVLVSCMGLWQLAGWQQLKVIWSTELQSAKSMTDMQTDIHRKSQSVQQPGRQTSDTMEACSN